MLSLEPLALSKGCWWLQRAELDGQIAYAEWLFEHWLTLYYIIWQEQSIQFSNILLSSRDELTKPVLWRVDLAEMEIEWFCVVWAVWPLAYSVYTMLLWSAADSLQLGKLCWYWHTLLYTRVVDNTALSVHQATFALSLKCCLYFAGVGGNSGYIHVLLRCS